MNKSKNNSTSNTDSSNNNNNSNNKNLSKQLFDLVFHNKFLSKKVFGYNKGDYRYKDIFSVDWIIDRGYFGLLKDKVKLNEKLHLKDPYCLFKIKDLQLFKLVFSRYSFYFVIEFPIQLYTAVQYQHYDIFKYLISLGYRGEFKKCYCVAWRDGQYQLVNYLLEIDHDIDRSLVLSNIIYSIKYKQKDTLSRLLDKYLLFNSINRNSSDDSNDGDDKGNRHGRHKTTSRSDEFDSIFDNSNNIDDERFYHYIYREVIGCGDIEIFKILNLYIPIRFDLDNWFRLGKENQNLVIYLLETYKGMISTQLIIDQLKTGSQHSYHRIKLVFYMLENSMISLKDYNLLRVEIVKSALVVHDWETVNQFRVKDEKMDFKSKILSDIDNWNSSLGRVKELHDLGVSIPETSVHQAIRDDNLEIYKYLCNKTVYRGGVNQHRKDVQRHRIAIVNRSAKILQFQMAQDNLNFDCDEIARSWSVADMNILALFALDQYPKIQAKYHELQCKLSIRQHNAACFKWNYSMVETRFPDKINMVSIEFYKEAIRESCVEILMFLIQEKKLPSLVENGVLVLAKTTQVVDILLEAGHVIKSSVYDALSTKRRLPNFNILEYVLSKSPNTTLNNIDTLLNISLCDKLPHHFHLLLRHHLLHTPPKLVTPSLITMISKEATWKHIEYFNQLTPNLDFSNSLFLACMESGNLDALEYLVRVNPSIPISVSKHSICNLFTVKPMVFSVLRNGMDPESFNEFIDRFTKANEFIEYVQLDKYLASLRYTPMLKKLKVV
ncbi:hypothetical protein CYY_001818 [Polysphondylium violaceum]|uniref:Ankyrin repeat-containing protein n=1 Tax=Polysphondylium violaceum TaxID=133409 RepID=A0A8J4PZF8_9MYCE|nr:hypothetical protein CYY_001818 [Polysphondylium violaceum]